VKAKGGSTAPPGDAKANRGTAALESFQ